MLFKTNILLTGLCFLLLSNHVFAQQREASPYPLLNLKQNFLDAEDYFLNKADFVLAEQLYREVYGQLSPKKTKEKAYVGLRIAFILCNLNRPDEALTLLNNIEKIISGQDKESELLLADLYTYRAKAYAKKINVDKALEWNDKAMLLKEKHYPELHPKLAESYAVYIYVHNYFTRNMKLSGDYLELEKQVVAKHPDEYPKYEQVAMHYSLASYYSIQREYLKASTNGKKAIQLLEPFKQLYPTYYAKCYALMGTVHLRMADAEPAIQYLQEALKYKVINRKDSLERAVIYTNLGIGYSLKGEMEMATNYFKRAMNFYSEQDKVYLAYSLNKLAEHYLNYPYVESNKSVLDSTYYCINKMIKLYESLYSGKNPNLASPYLTLGDYFQAIGDYDNAISSYHKALINSLPDFSNSSLNSMPLTQECIRGYLTESILYKKAYVLFKKALRKNDSDIFQQSLAIHELIDSINIIKKKYYTDEYSIINAPNLQVGYGVVIELLYHINELETNRHNIENTFKYMEQVKGYILLRNLIEINQSELFGVPDSLLFLSRKIASEINSYLLLHPENITTDLNSGINSNDTLFKLLIKKDNLESIFKKNYPNYYQVRFQIPPPTLEDVQEQLKDHALIEFYWAIDDVFALYFNENKAKLYRIPIDNQLTNNIESYITFLKENSKGGFSQFQKNSYYLYSKLLAPIFQGKIPKKLVIVPDGPLAAIPFETLITSESNYETINYRDLPYLLHHSAISYAYSSSTLLQAYKKSTLLDSPKLLAFSFSDLQKSDSDNSIINKYGLFPLYGAVEEVKSLEQLLPSNNFKAYFGQEATKDRFFSSYEEFDLVHLALHAQSDHSNRFNNRIFFYPENNQAEENNYICFAHELYDLNPAPRLVVLGACNTGAGTSFTGEGTYSTARGFIYGGTPSVVMSLWPLSDQASKTINKIFYEEILQGASLDEALQKAKLSFIKSSDEWTAHPSRWSALNLVGSTMPIVKSKPTISYGLICLTLLIIVIFIIFISRQKLWLQSKHKNLN